MASGHDTIILPQGSWWRSAGWKYSSGALHAAVDMACPIGLPVRVPIDGIVAETADGAHNNRPGESIWSGKRSNYVLLYCTWQGRKITLYFQHLSPGVRVRKGQRLKAGKIIGTSGNSGNSSGPHVHLHGYDGWQTWNRYANLSAGGANAVYDPLKIKSKGKIDMAMTKKDALLFRNVLMNTPMVDRAYPVGHKHRKTTFKGLTERDAARSHQAAQKK